MKDMTDRIEPVKVSSYKRLESDDALIQAQVRSKDMRFDFAREWREWWPTVLAEGDSWFNLYPAGIDLIDHLGGLTYDFKVNCYAHPGDTLEGMLKNPEWPSDLYRYNPRCLLFSGGGNDILGDPFETIVREKQGNPSPESLVNKQVLRAQVKKVTDNYKRVITITHAVRPDFPIFVHGYDYVIPTGEETEIFFGALEIGPWLRDVFERKGVNLPPEEPRDRRPSKANLSEAELVMNWVINFYNEELKTFASRHRHFHHIDLRGTLHDKEWSDEIHPTKAGAKKTAGKVKKVLTDTLKLSFKRP